MSLNWLLLEENILKYFSCQCALQSKEHQSFWYLQFNIQLFVECAWYSKFIFSLYNSFSGPITQPSATNTIKSSGFLKMGEIISAHSVCSQNLTGGHPHMNKIFCLWFNLGFPHQSRIYKILRMAIVSWKHFACLLKFHVLCFWSLKFIIAQYMVKYYLNFLCHAQF